MQTMLQYYIGFISPEVSGEQVNSEQKHSAVPINHKNKYYHI